MMTDPVVTAASHNPLLTTLAADVKAAGLTTELNSMASITVFSPPPIPRSPSLAAPRR